MHGKIVELELRCGHHRFPMQSALMLGVGSDDVNAPIFLVHLRSERHAGALREPFAQRARGRLERGQLYALGVPLQSRTKLAQRQQLLNRKIAEVGHRRVAHRRDVPAR